MRTGIHRIHDIAPMVLAIETPRDLWLGPLPSKVGLMSCAVRPSGCVLCAALHLADRPESQVTVGTDGLDADGTEDLASRIVLAGCEAVAASEERRAPVRALLRVDRRDGSSAWHVPSPHPACPSCYPIEATPAVSRQDTCRWGEHLGSAAALQDAPLASRLPALRRLADNALGLVGTPVRRSAEEARRIREFVRARGLAPDDIPLTRAAAFTVLRRDRAEGAAGEGFDFEDARRAEGLALVEALERRFTLGGCDPSRVEFLRLRDAGSGRVDPRDCQPYLASQFAAAGFPLKPFDPDTETGWLWGWDVTHSEPCRVPLDLVARDRGPTPVFAANSTGAACHGDARRAVINGILEIVERDAFMLAWLLRRSLPRIAFAPGDPDPGRIRETFERLDFDLSYVDITSDLGIPTVLGVLRDRHDPDLFLVDMVADPVPARAVAKLHRELAQFVSHALARPGCFVNACTVDDDPDAVRDFPDHAAFHQRADRRALSAFLTASMQLSPRDWRATEDHRPAHETLAALVALLAAHGHRVVAVDGTPQPVRDAGLHVVKVLVPGLQPLNAGHAIRALGGPRLARHAAREGIPDPGSGCNPWPHPFW